MNKSILIRLTLLCLAGAVPAIADSAPPATQPVTPPMTPPPPQGPRHVVTALQPFAPWPPYTLDRWNEDYSYLKDPARHTDFWDPIKYIPLGDNGTDYLSLGAQFRERYERFSDDLLLAPHPHSDHSGYNLQRFLPYADLHIGDTLRFFVQGRLSFEQGRSEGPRPNDQDQGDFEQAFVDLKAPIGDKSSVTGRFGRQDLNFGAQRLIGPSDFNNDRRTFDGIRATVASPGNSLDLFIVRPVKVEYYDLNSADDKTTFAGIYNTLSLSSLPPKGNTKLETYLLYLDRSDAAYAAAVTGTARDERFTAGSRISGTPGPFDFDLEGDYQFGSFHEEQISAFSVATVEGFTLSQVPLTPHPFIGFDAASGDRKKNNDSVGTFNQLFPTGHIYFGYLDALGRQNIVDVHPGFDLTLLQHEKYADSVALRTEYHEFWRESDHDAAYNVVGGVLRAAGTSKALYIGSELDLLLNWQIDPHLATYFGYSHFFDGQFLRDTGTAHGIDFLYAAVTYTF